MSGNLVAAGHDVRGVDPDPTCRAAATEHGVHVVDTIAEAVAGADAVFTSLPRGEHVREVLGGEGGVWATAPTSAIGMTTLAEMAVSPTRATKPLISISGAATGGT
jgi:3-hydroxyisobutyrate dehydrogenase